MYSLAHSQPSRFKKDYKRMLRRGKDKSKFQVVIDILISGKSLPIKYKNHELKGNYKGCMECHIEPDWILIYRVVNKTLVFDRTGSHSDLFKK